MLTELELFVQNIQMVRGCAQSDSRCFSQYCNTDTGNPELSGPDAVDVLTYQAGWVTHDTQWLPPNRSKWNETKDVVSNTTNWPGVNWPTSEENPIENEQEGEGDWGDFHIGHGGFCDDLDPPAGYVRYF